MRITSFSLLLLTACVGDDSSNPKDAGGNDVTTVSDGGNGSDVSNDATNDTAEAGPTPCGYPGEDCCKAPMAPCNDGLTCSTSQPQKCMVSEAWAVGEYQTQTSNDLPTVFVVAHYDGSTWTLGTPVKQFSLSFNSNDPYDILEVGTNVRVISNEADVGHEYWWSGVSWQDCKLGNSCVGPTMSTFVWAITAVSNSGSNDYWLAGSNTMYRCANGASSCTSTTNGLTSTWGQGTFAGQTAQDLWYSQYDHVLHYDGNAWSSMSVADAYTIGDVGKDDMWVGQKQLRHWDGKAWSSAFLVQGSQTPGTILAIGGSGSKDVHAVGNDQTQTGGSFASHWDGTGWKLFPLPTGMAHVQKIYAPSPIEAFVVGAATPAANKGMIAHWNGTAWSEMPSPTASVSGETQPGSLTWIAVTGQARSRAGSK